jgi:hypothetical protein
MHLDARVPHSVFAEEPSRLMLTMLDGLREVSAG